MSDCKQMINRIFTGGKGKTAIFLMGVLALMPGQVMAQAVCNAQLSANAQGGPLFYINEPIQIDLDLGAGIVKNFDSSDGWLDITEFSYQMDCSPGDTWPVCNPAGNTVVFNPASVTTDCKDENGTTLTKDDFETEVINQEVFFRVKDPLEIRNDSLQTCRVTFDVMVTAVDGDNSEKEIIELTGFGSFEEEDGGVADAICSNGRQAGAASSLSFNLSPANTNFLVRKSFSDDSNVPVNVNIKCYTGTPLINDFTLYNDEVVRFVVRDYEPGTLDCEIWETPVAGYEAEYEASLGTGVGIASDDAKGCYFDDVVNGGFICEIDNRLEAQKVIVYKKWVDLVDGENLIEQFATATWACHNVRETPDGDLVDTFGAMSFSGDSSDTIDGIYPDFGGKSWCEVEEVNAQSAVEIDQSECARVPVTIGADSSCTIYNTVFFEGIPTLSQYGMALMALLMLGMGMVGFRRFV